MQNLKVENYVNFTGFLQKNHKFTHTYVLLGLLSRAFLIIETRGLRLNSIDIFFNEVGLLELHNPDLILNIAAAGVTSIEERLIHFFR